jgi:hypothetical protein
MKSTMRTQESMLRDISQPITWNCGAFCVCVQPVEQKAGQDSLATRPRTVASFSPEASGRSDPPERETNVKQQRFLNQKLGKRISRKSELQRAKLETARALARQKDRK